MTTLRAITLTAISPPAINIISSAHLHPFTNALPIVQCTAFVQIAIVEEHAIHFAVVVPVSDSSTLDFICGYGQVATPPFCFNRVTD
jgi:hypothetical protein